MPIHDDSDTSMHSLHTSATHSRPHSIDLSLELERQLEIDSLPNSPAVTQSFKAGRPQSLDPQVLASIVTQLRLSLTEVSKERDDLTNLLAEMQAREQDLKDTLHTVSEKCLVLESELSSVTEKGKEDADAVIMLRGKLEDSRRALMRLQTENRRSSMAIDLSRAGSSNFNGPPSSRRSSFAPLTGSPGDPRVGAHRRISSVSEPSASYRDLSSPPLTGQLEPLQLVRDSSVPVPHNPRRVSGFFGRAVSPQKPELSPTVDASELEELRKELQAVKEQLEETRHELTETREAQEASETCANALRTFIAENSIGMHPPGRGPASAPPTGAGEADGRNSASSRWGFKLWNTAPSAMSTPATSPAVQNAPTPTAISAVPPSTRKFGGFFSSRSSISSTSSTHRPEPHLHQQEPIFNGSDSSSVDSTAEPVSPASELPPASIIVQSFDGVSSSLMDSPEQTKRIFEPEHVQIGGQSDTTA